VYGETSRAETTRKILGAVVEHIQKF